MSLDAIFKAYDIRGVYPDEIDEALARRIGNAFAHFTGAQQVIVGHDMRPSSVPLTAAFIEGATLAGADVTDIGLCSTDVVYFAAGKLDAPGAMFTASHNPAQYNGIKLCRAGAAPVGEQTGLPQIKQMVAAGVTSRGEVPGRVEHVDLLEAFGDHVRSFVDVSALKPLVVCPVRCDWWTGSRKKERNSHSFMSPRRSVRPRGLDFSPGCIRRAGASRTFCKPGPAIELRSKPIFSIRKPRLSRAHSRKRVM